MLAQQAIIVTKDNASSIADQVVDHTAQDILDEALYFLNRGHVVVLVRNTLSGVSTVSHIALASMFYANFRPFSEPTDKYFVDIVQR